MELTLEGSVDDLGASARFQLRQRLASLAGVPFSQVALKISAASVIAEATFTTTDEAAAVAVVRALFLWRNGGTENLSSRLGVTVVSMAAPYVELALALSPLPPPAVNLAPMTSPLGQKTGDGGGGGLSTTNVVLIVWVVVGVAILAALVILWYILRVRRQAKPRTALTAVSVHHAVAHESSTAEKPAALEDVVTSDATVATTPTGKAREEPTIDTSPPQQHIQREWLARQTLTPGEPMPTTPGV